MITSELLQVLHVSLDFEKNGNLLIQNWLMKATELYYCVTQKHIIVITSDLFCSQTHMLSASETDHMDTLWNQGSHVPPQSLHP